MPELKLASIVSASDAFEKFDASSLLDSRRHRPFKGKPGVECNVVIIKLAKEDTISLIDIGNEFTALIEIQVAKSCYQNPEYSTLLDTKFLMTPEESKKEKNGNKWYRFSKDDFNTSVSDSKWDLMKIVCKQSFNTKIPYGLTFISLTGGEEVLPDKTTLTPLGCALTPTNKSDKISSINDFKRTFFDDLESCLEKKKEEQLSPVSAPKGRPCIPRSAEGILLTQKGKARTPGSFTNEKRTEYFEKWKTLKEERNKNLAEKSPRVYPNTQLKTNVHKIKAEKENSSNDLFDVPLETQASDNSTTAQKENHSGNMNEKEESRKRLSDNQEIVSNKRMKVGADDEDTTDAPCINDIVKEQKLRNVNRDSDTNLKTDVARAKPAPLLYEPNLACPLKGVVVTLSGFQNPLRSQLREKALSLGALYSNDITPKVTHVLSAFRNTPKAKQAGPSVFVVSSFWLDRCVLERRRLDENLFSLKN